MTWSLEVIRSRCSGEMWKAFSHNLRNIRKEREVGSHLRTVQTNGVGSREDPGTGLEAAQNVETAPIAFATSQWSFEGFVSKFVLVCGCSWLVETVNVRPVGVGL